MAAPAPTAKIDWENLVPSLNLPSNGHVEVRHFLSTDSWTKPTLTTSPSISVSGLSPGLNYGQQCYEGLKAFRTPSRKITIFRPSFHAARLARSAASLCLPPPPTELFLDSIREAVAANADFVPPAGTDAYLYIRPVLFGASATVSLGPPEETILAVYVLPLRPYHGSTAISGVVLDEFDRAAPRGMGAYKVGGNYAPVWRHAARAKEAGFGITLHLDSLERRYVEEFSTAGFLGHKKVGSEDVLVAPDSESIIASVTRDSLIQLAREAGWKVESVPLPFDSLSDLDEVIAVGTAAAAVPIGSVSRLSTHEKFDFPAVDGKLIELARQLNDEQRGRIDDAHGWSYEVTAFPSKSDQ